jgi:sugar (pentulose or hexulose) kinase
MSNENPLLTQAEHRLITMLGEAMTVYAQEVVASGSQRTHDVNEFATGVHVLQHAVMSQAAARAYPGLYRLAGVSITEFAAAGACGDPKCYVLHGDPANPIHPPWYVDSRTTQNEQDSENGDVDG